MAPTRVSDRLVSWAGDLDEPTVTQAMNTAKLPIVAGHVALMADAHLGYGCAIGSVVPTEGAIIPSAVGVDIGCGMSAVKMDLSAGDLPDSLDPLLSKIEEKVPAGMGNGHHQARRRAGDWVSDSKPASLSDDQADKAVRQLGSLGSGNHFVEVSVDESGGVWVVLHSGSRGIGNGLAQGHIKLAKTIERHAEGVLIDPDLAWFTQGTPEFDAYVTDLRWAQAYAFENRAMMLDAVIEALVDFVGSGREVDRVQCHHNYAEVESHDGRELWITRKGAIRAGVGDRGVIPGSMGTDTFVVSGLGSSESYCSSSHGAGRKMSRTQARKRLSVDSLQEAMGDRSWLGQKAERLLDEHPDAYKDIEKVMAAQADLVRVDHRLEAILNYKGA